jgi:radical SAM protein with 4Fe4S-binding SPASM domain
MNPIKKIRERLKFITLPWLWNRVITELDSFQRKEHIKGFPFALIVEPCNICNLKCPLCPTGQRLPAPRGTMTSETFTRIINQLYPYVRHLNLFYLGEPLLCKHLPQMISYAHRHKIKVSVSSNLNVLNKELAEKLIESRLDHLIVSLDGAEQESYAKYRIGGNFQTVVENIILFNKKKRSMNSDYPRIMIQFVIFKHNEAEIPQIKKLARRLQVDLFFRQGALGGKGQSPPETKDRKLAGKWLTQNKKYQFQYDYFSNKPHLADGKCSYLWNVATINWDGAVLPCCWVYDSRDSYGNILQQDFKEIWNNEKFRSSRRLFSKSSEGLASVSNFKETVCYRCKMHKHSRNAGC